MTTTARASTVAAALATVLIFANDLAAYVTNGVTWAQSPVPYYLNPANMDGLSPANVEAAVRAGADAWPQQSGAAFSFTYAGQSSQTATTLDNINLVVFRNASNGSAIATTYWWSNSSGILDADIVFWDGGFTFFTGTSGCSGGFYIEDIVTHEFGHALGLGHSTLPAATMYPSTSQCNMNNRTLDADDIAGVRFLYPPAGSAPPKPTGLRILG